MFILIVIGEINLADCEIEIERIASRGLHIA